MYIYTHVIKHIIIINTRYICKQQLFTLFIKSAKKPHITMTIWRQAYNNYHFNSYFIN